MPNPGSLIKSYAAEAAVPGRRIVKFGSAAGAIIAAAAATDTAIGITDQLDAGEGMMADVIMSGSAELKMSGTGAAGAPVAANATGLGVAASTGVGNVAIGYALSAWADGDIINVVIARHSVT